LARRATRIDSLRAECEHLLLVDAGNFSDNTLTIGLAKSQFVFRMLDRLGYDAIGLGEQDLRHGPDAFAIGEGFEASVLTSNLVRAGTSFRRAYDISEVGPFRVGVFSLVSRSLPRYILDEYPGYRVADPESTAAVTLDAMRADGVDVVILLSQLPHAEAESLLVRFDEIDVAVMGHVESGAYRRGAHPFAAVPIYPRARGQGMARLDCVVDPEGRISDYLSRHDEIHVAVSPRRDIVPLVSALDQTVARLQADARLARTVELENRRHADRFLGEETCARCHQEEARAWATTAHAHALTTLEELGMDREAECLQCHTVGHGAVTGFASPAVEPDLSDVQCESCHGRGSDHHARDLSDPEVVRATCVECHDAANSPDFDLASYLEKIRHW
jgi:hypothetical protein